MPVGSSRRPPAPKNTLWRMPQDEDESRMSLDDASELEILSAHDPLGREPLDDTEIHSLEGGDVEGDEEQQLSLRALHDTTEMNFASDVEDDTHAASSNDAVLDVRTRPPRRKREMRLN